MYLCGVMLSDTDGGRGSDYGLRTRATAAGKREVWCMLRRRWVALTPEEWVRQLFTHHLVEALGYPRGLMGNEVELCIGQKRVRCDTVVYDRRLRPLMVIEYKSETVALTQRVVNQVMAYNWVLQAPLLTVTNGQRQLCWHADYTTRTCTFLERLPRYDDIGPLVASYGDWGETNGPCRDGAS